MTKYCYYVPKELLKYVTDRYPDAIGLDFNRPIEEQLQNYAERIKNTVPKTILDQALPQAEVERLTLLVKNAHKRIQVTIATGEVSWPIWFRNSLHNYPAITQGGLPVDDIDWPHAKKPAIIVGSGPSIQETAPRILANRDQYCVIATWHSLYRLQQFNLQPDAVIHIDKLAPVHTPPFDLPQDVPVIMSPVASPEFLAQFTGHPVYYYLGEQNDANVQWAAFLEREPHKPALGTVVASGIRVAQYLGHNQIILTGVDLCFPDKESFTEHGIRREEPLEVTRRNNKKGYAPQSFLMYKEVLEDMAKEEKEAATFYNASPGGLALQGYLDWKWD